MDIADFLQLQGSFQSHRILEATTQIDKVARIGECAAEVGYLVVQLQHLLHLLWDVPKLFCNVLVLVGADGSLLIANGQCKKGKYCHLTGEGLG